MGHTQTRPQRRATIWRGTLRFPVAPYQLIALPARNISAQCALCPPAPVPNSREPRLANPQPPISPLRLVRRRLPLASRERKQKRQLTLYALHVNSISCPLASFASNIGAIVGSPFPIGCPSSGSRFATMYASSSERLSGGGPYGFTGGGWGSAQVHIRRRPVTLSNHQAMRHKQRCRTAGAGATDERAMVRSRGCKRASRTHSARTRNHVQHRRRDLDRLVAFSLHV
jgi:hypothetical protein